MMRRLWQGLRPYFALIGVAAVFAWSALYIRMHRTQETPPGTITLRLGHWQLESSVRDAFNDLAAEYQKTHPNVRIVQDAIPESTYGQWVSTQLMGGTAPDIMELGLGLPYQIWLSYYNRYFIPMTRYVNRPNPYNAGTEMEHVPLRNTYKDGMRTSYIDEMQEYINIPLAQFGVRIFYNRDLLRRLTGLEEPPTEYRAFLEVCRRIGSQKDPRGRNYIAIAGSKYHIGMWEGMMMDPITYGGLKRVDFNRDGYAGNDETYVAFKSGRVDLHYPPFAAKFKMLWEVTEHFQSGYTGLTRDEAVMLFAQQRAVFMTTGTWDARSLEQQAEGRFGIGVMEFPLPLPTDPEFGPFVDGRVYERPMSGFPFGVTRTSKHPEVAIDFLLFLASKRQNERLNRIIGWIPAIQGTDMDPLLRAFEPHLEGVYSALSLQLGGETWIKWLQVYSLYQVRQITFDQLAAEFEPFYKDRGMLDFLEIQKDWRRGMQIDEQFLAGIRARALAGDGPASGDWIKYRALMASRMVMPEIWHAEQMRLVEKGPALGAIGPYEYGSNVMERVRARLGRTQVSR